MNDRQDPYGQQQFTGYDEYGRPLYHDPYAQGSDGVDTRSEPEVPAVPQSYGHDYGYPAPGGYGQQGYGYDPYAGQQGATAWVPQQPQPEEGYPAPSSYPDQGPGPSYPDSSPYPPPYPDQATASPYPNAAPYEPEPAYRSDPRYEPEPPYEPEAPYEPESGRPAGEAAGGHDEESAAPAGAEPGAGSGEEYRTEQFSFIEEEDAESEDVIDWLKFSESRTERREEAKRRGRNRMVALVVALVVVLVGGVGYLWSSGRLPGLGGEETEAATQAAEQRDVIVLHLRDIDTENVSTVLLVDNETAGRGTAVLLPNSLALTTTDGSTTTLGKSFDSQGAGATREALGTLLGATFQGTWRLDTPFLENLVDSVGGVTLDADVTIPADEKGEPPLVGKGADRELNGRAAIRYATHLASGEEQTKQLGRFGQVMVAVLGKLSTDPAAATRTVVSLGQVPDPSLTDGQLGGALAELAAYAGKDRLDTRLLPVEQNGTLSDETAHGLVKEVLGGTVRNPDPDAAVRVSVRNATGDGDAAQSAQITLINGGYTVVPAKESETVVEASTVTYAEKTDAQRAEGVAKTLGLPEDAVRQGEGAANADVTVVLGENYED
ncbi:LCP family protein [Streptomyces sp. WMMC1477]|uniref:LCP family protein n=1 Tax=Streptomyces sp. WMMC1477 TaxID=3015155 RepID=UPI0022B606AD|nr:LytR C-terminal domain-containing protein [Streptomyces sp. WMMC1477]MCZ7431208.1 LytR C-terminal domain-containing protein [Streptomyces sp. WMMC1477]